jgi:hypothetical protein
MPEGGVIRLAKWPEGYVLWYHGEIVWRSWLNKPQHISVTLSADTKPVRDAIAAAQQKLGGNDARRIIGDWLATLISWQARTAGHSRPAAGWPTPHVGKLCQTSALVGRS